MFYILLSHLDDVVSTGDKLYVHQDSLHALKTPNFQSMHPKTSKAPSYSCRNMLLCAHLIVEVSCLFALGVVELLLVEFRRPDGLYMISH